VLARYILRKWPRLVAAFQGLPFGLVIYLCFAVNRRIFQQQTTLPFLTAVLATVIGVTGAATVSQIGTSFNEIQVAALVLAGVCVMLPRGQMKGPSPRCRPRLAGRAWEVVLFLALPQLLKQPLPSMLRGS
jgi:hypothetical protein